MLWRKRLSVRSWWFGLFEFGGHLFQTAALFHIQRPFLTLKRHYNHKSSLRTNLYFCKVQIYVNIFATTAKLQTKWFMGKCISQRLGDMSWRAEPKPKTKRSSQRTFMTHWQNITKPVKWERILGGKWKVMWDKCQ